MIVKAPNKMQLKLCGEIRAAGRCPELCDKHGGCFMPQLHEPVTVAEYKRRCHRANQVRWHFLAQPTYRQVWLKQVQKILGGEL